jgi:type IV pilus assembly protein PilB
MLDEGLKMQPATAAETPSTYGVVVSHLLADGLVTDIKLKYALRIQSKLESQKPLLGILKDLKCVTNEQIRKCLQSHAMTIPLGDLLVELGYISSDDLELAIKIQKEEKSRQKIGQILIAKRLVDEGDIIKVLSMQMGFVHITPGYDDIDAKIFGKAPVKWYEKHCFVPVRRTDEGILIAFSDPLDVEALEAAKRFFGPTVVKAIAFEKDIRSVLEQFRRQTDSKHSIDLNDDSIVGLANSIIVAAIDSETSDIHIEPMEDRLRVRFRQDGILVLYKDFSLEIVPMLTSRIKVLCGADIVEKRRHQGGRLFFNHRGYELDLRASFYVTVYGEKIVLRLLNRKGTLIQIDEIGMAPRMKDRFVEEALLLPSGVMMVTGPTGSGKTTTIYSCINHIKNPQISIITAEEPVEYIIDGISQCSINPKINLTFQETLRHIVRQDPDVIVIGEIRDNYSAEVAVQAALTGHKVLTTFHTEDSIGGLVRLLNMEIEAFMISSTVISVLAQRLLRRVCSHCGAPCKPDPAMMQRIGYEPRDCIGWNFRKGKGCRHCNYTGYRGRVGVFELLILDEKVRNAILERKTSYDIRQISIESTGLVTLMEDGAVKAAMGITTPEEVLRCLPKVNKPRPLNELRHILGV